MGPSHRTPRPRRLEGAEAATAAARAVLAAAVEDTTAVTAPRQACATPQRVRGRFLLPFTLRSEEYQRQQSVADVRMACSGLPRV
jgi:hypothetical protein